MRLAEIIEKQFKNKLKTKASPELDRRIDNLIIQAEKMQNQTSNKWKTIMKTRITKFAAAAIILIAVFAITVLDKLSTPAYGLTQALQVYKQANIIHMKGLTFFVKDTKDGQEHCGLPYEKWIDREKGYFRELRPCGTFGSSPDETPHYYLTVSDGQYLMKTFDTQYFVSDESDELGPPIRRARYKELSPFQQRLQMRTMQNIMDYYSVCDVAGFAKIGSEAIDGEELDIWQGEVASPGKTVPYKKLMVWLSPTSGEIKQIYRWSNTQMDNNEVSWRLAGIINFEYDAIPPEGCFDTVPPPDCELENTRETAIKMELGMYDGRETFYICIGFGLNDGSVILGWHAHQLNGQLAQEELFKNLEPGGPLPQLPAQITELVPYPVEEDITCVGHHLTYTQKAGKFYEWGLYVPNGDMPSRSLFTSLKVKKEFHNSSKRDYPGFPNLVANEISIGSEQEFNTWVLDAMAELSDDGMAPEGITYDGVLELAQQIRGSLDE